VGDAPPHVDYQDGLDYRRHAREAAARGIVIETIQCGADDATAARYWSGRAWAQAGNETSARARWTEVQTQQPTSYYSVPAARRLG